MNKNQTKVTLDAVDQPYCAVMYDGRVIKGHLTLQRRHDANLILSLNANGEILVTKARFDPRGTVLTPAQAEAMIDRYAVFGRNASK